MSYQNVAMLTRFWKKVNKTKGCWLWRAHIERNGYGLFWLDGRNVSAHKLAWEIEHGPVPAGLELDHLCRVRHCVRPDHMETVTHIVNMHRGKHANTRKTHCIHGHEFTPENTYVWLNGSRHCRTCDRCRHVVYRQGKTVV